MLSASWWFLYQKDVPRKLAFFITNLYCILETAFPYLYPLILKIRWTQNPLLSLFNKWREARPRNLCISHSPTWSSCLVIQFCPTLSDPKDCSLGVRLLCPWDSSGKNTGVGCHFFLQEIFQSKGSNPCLLYCRQILYLLSHRGSPPTRRISLK